MTRLITSSKNPGDPDDPNDSFWELNVRSIEWRGAAPIVTYETTISPTAGYSMHDVTVTEADRHDIPGYARTNPVLVTWREMKLTSGAASETVKYVVLRDVGSKSSNRDLALTSWNWSTEFWQDYSKGASYWTGTNFRFFGQWTQSVSGKMQVFTNWVDVDE